LLQEPRRGVAGLAKWVETDADGAAQEASASEDVSSPIGRSIGRSVTYFSVTKLQCNIGQHDAT